LKQETETAKGKNKKRKRKRKKQKHETRGEVAKDSRTPARRTPPFLLLTFATLLDLPCQKKKKKKKKQNIITTHKVKQGGSNPRPPVHLQVL
jgi:hypothetical protein